MKRLTVTKLLNPLPRLGVDVFLCYWDTQGKLVRERRAGGTDGKVIYIDDIVEGGIYSVEYGVRFYHREFYVVWDGKATVYDPSVCG